MRQYHDLLKQILESGSTKEDRTGTGTISSFGHQMKFDLSEGFPLLTTKKTFWKGTVEELLWFISGSTDVTYLQERGVQFWNSWVDENNSIGPGYGKQMRSIEYITSIKPKTFNKPESLKDVQFARTIVGVGFYGDCDADDANYETLVNIWKDVIGKCYDESHKVYKDYGGKGVHVSDEWHCFANFQKDVKKLPGWELKLTYPNDYILDKDVLWASNRYGKDTCMWASHEEHLANTSANAYFAAIDEGGDKSTFSSIAEVRRRRDLNATVTHRCLNGKLKAHNGLSDFQYVEVPEGTVLRYRKIDQLKQVVASIKHNPSSRRHIISLWNIHDVDRMQLPPCHGNIIQFYVSNGKLSCQMYQRSADTFLGLPVNIASYALLTFLIAHECSLEPGELIISIGDCHIYLNHVEQAKELLAREPRALPTIKLNQDKKSIFDFKFEDILLEGYNPHPVIKGKVAV